MNEHRRPVPSRIIGHPSIVDGLSLRRFDKLTVSNRVEGRAQPSRVVSQVEPRMMHSGRSVLGDVRFRDALEVDEKVPN